MRHFLDHHQGSFFPLFKLWYKCTGLDTPAVQWRVRDWSRKDHILCKHSSFTRTATLLEAENNFVITNPQPSTGCTVLVWKAVMESLEKYWVPRNKTPTRGGGEGGVTAPWLRYIMSLTYVRVLCDLFVQDISQTDTILRGACFNDGRVGLGARKGISFPGYSAQIDEVT